MSAKPPFLLDANIFIAAADNYYAFDLVPQFWDALVLQAKAGRLFTIDRVAAEVHGKGDLQAWMDGPFAPFIRGTGTPDTLVHYARLMQWSQTLKVKDAAKDQFAKATIADAWVAAHAKLTGATVVTFEKSAPSSQREIKLPDACKFLGVECVDTFAMLRGLGVKLA